MRPVFASVTLVALCSFALPAQAQWTWSSERGWVNRRYAGSASAKELEAKAKAEEKAKKAKKAAKTRAKIADKFPLNESQAKAALFKAAETAYEGGEYLQAEGLYRKYLKRHGHDSRHAKVQARRYDIGRAIVLGTHLPKGMSKAGAYDQGEKILRTLIEEYPLKRQPKIGPDEITDDAMFVLGSYYLREQRHEEAILAYKRLRKTFPTSEWAEKAGYQIGVANKEQAAGANYDATKLKRAKKAMADAGAKDPDSKVGKAARDEATKIDETLAEKDLRTAKFYIARKRTRAARIYLKRAISKYPGTKAAAEAKTLLAGMGK